ncbi:hypothetical protein ACJQWK_09149 [Exserohilum turcicum]|uniref:Uncharacterized protein n=1 Tax=Exserohilum turcicum (strain 28A) TaxID=671987 RepID=R0K1K2_EXST2|nr:uncharacterized protein SETTUDRAFT_163097 [Exserohilum turcica Et28A]EOA87023.1 hypothetical protein SETTUDRAFT_163097 [Exserohilum turcica Et28A]
MAGLSVTSTASSFIKKLCGKSNPYEKAYRAQSNTTSAIQTTNPPTSTRTDNHHDLLAEARQAAGRDPLTGRKTTRIPDPTSTERYPARDTPAQTAAAHKAAYLAWAAQNPEERGTPYASYEEYVQEMLEKRHGGRDAVRSETSYYAPERRVQEYYAERVRD